MPALMLLFSRIRNYYQAARLELDLGLLPHRPLPSKSLVIPQNQRGLLLATVLRASTDVVICAIPNRLAIR